MDEIQIAHERVEAAQKAANTAQQHLQNAQAHLRRLQDQCHHDWTTKYDPIIHPAGSDPGDPPGTMGVDWRPPSSWPERQEPRWSRTCKKCRKVEYTTRSKPPTDAQKVPDFGR